MSHISTLWIVLISLILLSTFFSMAETAYMSVNRYRIRHLAKKGHVLAKRVQALLERPDRLLGVILLGDTFANIAASSIGTLIAVHYLGDVGVVVAMVVLTFVILILGQLAPKTLAALQPTRIVLSIAWPLWILLKLIYPVVWFVNILSNSLLRILGVKSSQKYIEHFTVEELRTVVTDASRHISSDYQRMILQLLDLEKISVEDIMVPRSEIVGINLEENWPDIIDQLTTTQHTRIPVYRQHIDHILGVLHLRDALNLLAKDDLTLTSLQNIIEKPYFIPEGTPLSKQLLQFSQQKIRTGLVVDEYGDVLGLVALDDILEEIVGEFTTDTQALAHKEILKQPEGSYVIDGSINLRVLNRTLGLHFPLEGPKTLSGLIIEYLEMIPPANICVKIAGYPIEILLMKDNMVKTVRLVGDGTFSKQIQ